MSGPSAWMPFYVGDYLGDTQRLTTEQHGAYLLLMLDYWRNGPAPSDDAVLQQITKLDKGGWKRCKPALERMFQTDNGEWRHKRIDRELENAASNSERRSTKAKIAAQARWGDAPSNAKSNAPSMPEALLVECPPQSPSPEEGSVDKSTAPADLEKSLFDSGKAFLASHGVAAGKAGPLLGKWKRDHGAAAVIEALGAAQREGAIDPVSFIEGRWRHVRRAEVSEYGPC